MNFLIVDDSELWRDFERSMLQDHIIFECNDGSEALAAYIRHRPDWVLMDINMPGVDGLEAARQIRTHDQAAKIIFVTRFADEALRLQAREIGAFGFVLKENFVELFSLLCLPPSNGTYGSA